MILITFPVALEADVRAFHPTVAAEELETFAESAANHTFSTSRLDAAGVAAYEAEFGDSVTINLIE